ncbi:hypothetical protein A2110_00665 [Candidatus Jorgensenbacteria bacterium GWA1_54_12]|uniref:Segregation and condensation protein A n=1 Tax=Candidatus Jorgensenbacteria bacterium GWA1_54_12 TaxID=1798468 RepID=A0A1F6BM61_9BACT|nr:MAG: hypothetical protein A2110_00665 [Candidatus Jorgensenbacteria bacterium GWA1_54_12]
MYTVRESAFEGPLDKLLELIKKRELEITRVSLAAVTNDFLKYVTRDGISHEEYAEFLNIASKLILLKSQELLPTLALTEEEEEDVKALEEQLRLHAYLTERKEELLSLWREAPASAVREFMQDLRYPFTPPRITVQDLAECAARLAAELITETAPIPEKKIRISLENIMARLLERLTKIPANILARAVSREERIALFLAILHLSRNAAISVHQAERFGEILVAKSSET